MPAYWLVQGDPLFRILRWSGLIPAKGLGVLRRILFFVLVCWVPLVALAFLEGRTVGQARDPLFQHFAIHARCLVAIPLFVLADCVANRSTLAIRHFVSAGLVDEALAPRFWEILRQTEHLKNSWLPFTGILVLVILNSALSVATFPSATELSWAVVQREGGPGLVAAGWWSILVTRAVFLFLLLTWLWRGLILGLLLWRISRLDLRLVPAHADQAGGLGFVDVAVQVLVPVVFAISAVVAASFGHEVRYHGRPVASYYNLMALLVLLSLFFILGPLLAFAGKLSRLKVTSRLNYGGLVAQHGRLVDRRWIRGETLEDDALLNAGELGPVVDIASMHEIVRGIRLVPFNMQPVLMVVVAALLPMVPVLALQIPLKEMLMKLVSLLK
jgi:hypothetical protein